MIAERKLETRLALMNMKMFGKHAVKFPPHIMLKLILDMTLLYLLLYNCLQIRLLHIELHIQRGIGKLCRCYKNISYIFCM